MDPADPRALQERFASRVDEFARVACCASHRELTALLAEALEPAPRGPLLELGCATGSLLAVAGCRFDVCVGLDVSQPMCRAAREARGCPVVCGDAQSLPFGPGRFAAVGGLFYFQLVRDPARALAEARRVLLPGGVLAFVLQAADWSEAAARGLARSLGADAFESGYLERCAHVAPGSRRYADDELADLLVEAGLRNVMVTRALQRAVLLARGTA